MSEGDRYYSVSERITWTTGFRLPVDQMVLGKLATFANFKTGQRATMRLEKLVARCTPLSRSTVLRALQRLERDGWITAIRQHRRPTRYDICVDRLAPHWREATLVPKSLSVTGDTQKPESSGSASLSVTGKSLSVTGDTQRPVLSVTGDTPSPVRTDPQVDPQRTGTSPQPQILPLGLTDQSPAPRYDASQDIAAIRERLKAAAPFDTRQERREKQQRHG